MPNFFIGFTKLSEFIIAIDRARPLYLAPLDIVKPGNPCSTVRCSLVASQPKRDHLLYCKIDYSAWSEIHSRPFGPEEEARAARAAKLQRQMWAFIVEQLRAGDPDQVIYEGTPSFPTDLMLIPGNIDGITYDRDLREFVREAA
jgi:hypothetical protein